MPNMSWVFYLGRAYEGMKDSLGSLRVLGVFNGINRVPLGAGVGGYALLGPAQDQDPITEQSP